MKLSGKKIIYGITLEDYFTADFCSSTKTYFGSLDEIKSFIDSLDDKEFENTKASFKKYLEGDAEATHYVAYSQYRLINKVEVMAEKEIELDKTSWEFLNVWRWPQFMEIDRGSVKMMLLYDGKTYFRAVKATVSGLRTSADEDRPKDKWHALCGCFWGHPCILIVTVNDETCIIYSSLYMKEKEYETKEEAIEKFETDPVSLDCICEDVFGNG